MKIKPNIILASSSPYRKMLLERLEIEFTTESPGIDEQLRQDESVNDYVIRLAEEKAKHVAQNHPNSIIIGSDQSLECDGMILGKPNNHENATEQLRMMSGKSLVFYTGLCLFNSKEQIVDKDVITYQVCFRELGDSEIERYLNKEQPYQCAGSFKSEKLGVSLLSKMQGADPSALIGLPLIRLCEMLRGQNIEIP